MRFRLFSCVLFVLLVLVSINCAKKSSIAGRYEFIDEGMKHFLILKEDLSFHITLNYCQGLDNVKGEYLVDGNTLKLKVKSRELEGYDGAEIDEYKLEIVSRNELKFLDCVGCNPCKGDIFQKVK